MLRINRVLVGLLLGALLSACLPTHSPAAPERNYRLGEPLRSDSFDERGSWDTYDAEGLYLNVEDSLYRVLHSLPGQFAFALDHQPHENVVIEVDVAFRSRYDSAMAGVMCRANPQNDGRGYYFLISGDGAFSIRRGVENAVDPLVSWQDSVPLRPTGAWNQLRLVCAGDYLALYVNGDYIESTTDRRYRSGSVGLVAGLPPYASPSETVAVEFDNLRVWDASLPD